MDNHFTEQDHEFMGRALELAKRGLGLTNPNPMVGCVVARDGRIIAEGWHRRYGEDHAEAMALKKLENAIGATLYVNLEPCNHTGKTPPCSELIIRKRVSRVVYAVGDPNPVAGGGARRLAEAGVTVQGGLLQGEAARLNEIFIHWVTHQRPLVVMKYAMTLDGRIATVTGDSRWITGPEARGRVHALRQQMGAVMVGCKTVLADDPELSVRDWEGEKKQPLRVVLDPQGRVPLSAKVFQNQRNQQTLLATSEDMNRDKAAQLEKRGVHIWRSGRGNGPVDLRELLGYLGLQGCDSVLAEGGAAVHGSLLDGGLVDRVYAFVAPRLIGGSAAPGPVGGEGRTQMAHAVELTDRTTEKLGPDILITGTPRFEKEE